MMSMTTNRKNILSPSFCHSSPQTWSELPSLVVEMIVSYLGKSDLLNSRLICPSWNEVIRKVLQKSKFTQTLSETKIEKYIVFMTHSKFNSPTTTAILPFHLNFRIEFKNTEDTEGNNHFKILTRHVQSMCLAFGTECVVSKCTLTTEDLTTTGEDLVELGLFELLRLISPSLIELDFTGFKVQLGVDTIYPNPNLTFPKLKKMKSCSANMYSTGFDRLMATSMYTSIYIVQNSPNLKDLKIQHSNLEPWPMHFDKLKTLTLRADIYPSVILNKMQEFNSTRIILEELRFENPTDNIHSGWGRLIDIHDILKLLSPTLKTLKIYNILGTHSKKQLLVPLQKFPRLPHLETLGLGFYNPYGYGFLNYKEINLTPETLPSLATVNLPIGLIFSSTSNYQRRMQDGKVDVVFPGVKNLSIEVDPDKMLDKNIKMERLVKMYPNFSCLRIKNGRRYYVPGRSQKNVGRFLDQIIQSDWSTQIHTIKLIGFDQDYLGPVLSKLENSSSHHRMTNVKMVRLDIGRSMTQSSSPEMPNLSAMGMQFPHLRKIEISEELFPNNGPDKRVQIQEFSSRFPTVVIDII